MSNNRITPFVRRMRTNGGTIYTFSSSVEDIGLNINERNNVVKISHFALLDIPKIQQQDTDIEVNRFNITNITGAFEYEQEAPSIKDGRVLIAESFENYALNLESNLLNQDSYEPTVTRTVTERVFWKWLKETGAVRWQPDVSVGSKRYWSEEIDADGSLGYNSVVKYVGLVSAGNARSDTFGTYNETYVLVPTSHGQTDAYFEIVEDENYYHGMEIGNLGEKILGRESYTLPHPDALSYNAYYDFVDSSTQVVANGNTWTMKYDNSTGSWENGWWYTAEGIEPSSVDNAYLTDSSIYMSSGIYNVDLQYEFGASRVEYRRSKVDCLSLVLDLDELKNMPVWGPNRNQTDSTLTYDSMGIKYSIGDDFDFNTVLIYYTVYNSTMDQVLGRNLLGVMFIDAPNGNSSNISADGIIIPALEKIQSGPGGFGTSYSLRLNIKTDTMVDDTQLPIVDKATSDQVYAEDWAQSFANLNTAVNILTQNNGTINYLSEQYIDLRSTQTQILNDLQALQYTVNDIGRDIQGTANTLALFADGDDPLVDSSVYMRFGKVGIKIKTPQYPLHISGTTKADDIIIENAIKDTSGNVILGYGSPLQLGSSTNDRDIAMYVGEEDPVVYIDASGLALEGDVSISGDVVIDGSATINGTLNAEEIRSPNFDFTTSYIRDTSNGATLRWINGFLEASVGSSTTAAGSPGNIQFANNAGLLGADSSLNWDFNNYILEVNARGEFSWGNNGETVLSVERNNPPATPTGTNYNIGLESRITEDYYLPTGQTDSGYRMALSVAAFANNPLFEGTLNEQVGIRIQFGDYTSATGGGTVNTAKGIEIETLGSGSTSFGNLYSIHSDSVASRMYHAGDIRIGDDSPTQTSKLNVYDNTASKYAAYIEQDNASGYGVFIDTDNNNTDPALRVDGGGGTNILNVQGNRRVGINYSPVTQGTLVVSQLGTTHNDGFTLRRSGSNDAKIFINSSDEMVLNRLGTNDGVRIGTSGAVEMPNIGSGTGTGQVIYYNTTTGELTQSTAPGGGNVSTSGSPAVNQVAVFASGTTIGGSSSVTWNGTKFDINGQLDVLNQTDIRNNLIISGAGNLEFVYNTPREIFIQSNSTANTDTLTIRSADSTSSGVGGGALYLKGGSGLTSGAGGHLHLEGGNSPSGTDGRIYLGNTNTSGIYSNASAYPSGGTPGSNEVLYLNGGQIKRGSVTSSPAGSDTNMQYNNAGSFGGASTVSYDNSGDSLHIVDTGESMSGTQSPLQVLRTDNVNNGSGRATLANFAIETRYTTSSGSGQAQGIKFTIGNGSTYTGTGAIYAERTGTFGQGALHFAVNDSGSSGKTDIPRLMTIDGPNARTSWYSVSNTERVRINNATGQIDAAGNVVAYSTIFSDERLKKDINPLGKSLDKILQLEGVTYKRKSNDEEHVGFIAQKVEKIIPEVVEETPLPLETGDEKTPYKTLRYQEMIPYLVEAMKEQQEVIEELKREINELKNK